MVELQPRWQGFVEATKVSAEAVTAGAAVVVDSNGKWAVASAGATNCCVAAQTHTVLSSGNDIYGATYDGTRNPYTIRKDNVGEPLAVFVDSAVLENYDYISGSVAIGDELYCIGSSGRLGNLAALEAAVVGITATQSMRIAIADSAGTSMAGSNIRIRKL